MSTWTCGPECPWWKAVRGDNFDAKCEMFSPPRYTNLGDVCEDDEEGFVSGAEWAEKQGEWYAERARRYRAAEAARRAVECHETPECEQQRCAGHINAQQRRLS